VIVTARNEAERLGATLRALREAFPDAELWVADDASEDATAAIAAQAGARVVTAPERLGKGGTATLVAEQLDARVVVLADGDLGESARRLSALVSALDRVDLAIGVFARRVGGGFGIAVRTANWAIERATGDRMAAPLSGQRAMKREVLDAVLPFAPGFGMETGMTIDALRADFRIAEVELPLEHRATGKTPAGFLHRGRQLRDILRAYASRRS